MTSTPAKNSDQKLVRRKREHLDICFVNVNPLVHVLATEYQIEISGEAALPAMKIRAEARRAGLAEAELAGLSELLGAALNQTIRVSVGVEILSPGALPRPDGRRKMRRVVDLRQD